MSNRRVEGRGCTVAADGGVYYVVWGPFGTQGGGPTTIPADDQKQLDKLLSKLPDDGARLPPPGRRVVLQVPERGHCRARVYDRANAPDEVLEILRLSRSGVPSWVPEFKSESEVQVDVNNSYRMLALSPDAGAIMIAVPPNGVAIMDRSFRFWDPATHKELKELPLSYGRNPQGIKFSPDGSLAEITGKGWGSHCCVIDTKARKIVREFQEDTVGPYICTLGFPQFTADGRFLVFLCSQPDSNGHRTILPQVYDTKSWEKRDKLPGYPENTLTCIETAKGKKAIVLLKGGVVALWDSERHREYAKLDENVQIRQVAFSPDESMVAMATLHEREGQDWPTWTSWGFRIRIWKMATGELVHELRPFEQNTCETVVGLQWTADGQYILAATKSSGSEYDLDIWNAKSGRHRGNLIEYFPETWGIVVVPDGSHVVAGGNVSGGGSYNRVIRSWDLHAALKQIRAFEDSLAEPKAGK
ncbi:MAG: WD40 repeat domain-containing protein [Thermoguttaceae bacterium]